MYLMTGLGGAVPRHTGTHRPVHQVPGAIRCHAGADRESSGEAGRLTWAGAAEQYPGIAMNRVQRRVGRGTYADLYRRRTRPVFTVRITEMQRQPGRVPLSYERRP
jgi:hypothetical protein